MPEWQDDHRKLGMQIVQFDADDFIRVESKWTNVEILLVTFSADQLEQAVDQFVAGVRQFHAEQFCRLQETTEMALRTKHEQLLLILIPVRAETAENGGSIIESVR